MRLLKLILCMSLGMCTITTTYAQERSTAVYEWDWATDGLWTGAALGGTAYGFTLIQNKKGITEADIANLNKDNINFIDRWVAGNYDPDADAISYPPFYAAFAMPLVLLIDGDINDDSLKIMGMYIESLSTTAAMYTITAGLANRSRPYVYSDNAPDAKRMANDGQRSFYSGHVAATATATFFAAKVFSDYHPDSKALPYIWVGAAALPAAVGYFRLQAGQHFLTDVILGYALGAVTGYAVPALHKKDSAIKMYPTGGIDLYGNNTQSLAIQFTF